MPERCWRSGPWSPGWQARALAARLRRQQILDRSDGTAPRLVAVITEASLLYRWGSQEDRRAQVAHLAAMSRRPSVELRLLRFADGPHPGMISLINIFDFPDDEDPSVVYLENDTGIQEVTKASEVDAYRETFARIREAALAPAATRTYLDTLSQTRSERAMTDLSRAVWRKASRSGSGNGGCVEIASNLRDVIAIRDSKRPEDGVHVVDRAAFAAFLADVKAGRYDG